MRKISIGFILLLSFLVSFIAIAQEEVIQYGPVALRLSASSVLPANKGITYVPENVLDNDPKTAWIEGQPGVDDAFITFQFDKKVELYGFEHIPGYAKARKYLLPIQFQQCYRS